MSTLKADTIQNTSGGVATLTNQYTAKQWANVDHKTDNAIDNSVNTSSLTDNSTGISTLSFTNNFVSVFQVPAIESFRNASGLTATDSGLALPTTGTIKVVIMNDGASLTDAEYGESIIGDLA